MRQFVHDKAARESGPQRFVVTNHSFMTRDLSTCMYPLLFFEIITSRKSYKRECLNK